MRKQNIITLIRSGRRLLAIIGIIFLLHPAFPQGIPLRPNPPRLVNDLAGILAPEQVSTLERDLVAFNDSTSNQIVVITTNDLGEYDPSQYAFEIGQKWGVGQKDFNNGIVILVKPKQGNKRGEVFIATGYGLEGAIPDATNKLIVEQEMIPRFRNNDYYGGITAAVSVLKGLASGEFKSDQYQKKKGNAKGWTFLVPIFVFLILFLIFRNGRNNHQNIGKRDMSFWAWLILLNSLGGGRGGSSGGWGGGSGGGGFGGFGGGGFGGGGAGGSW